MINRLRYIKLYPGPELLEGVNPRPGWTDQFPFQQSFSMLRELARRHLVDAGPNFAHLQRLLSPERIAEFLEFAPNYAEMAPEEARHIRLAMGLFEKWADLNKIFKRDLEAIAYGKFVEGEALCAQTNARFRSLDTALDLDAQRASQFWEMRKIIKRILGPRPKFWELRGRLGPGATTATKRQEAVPSYKLAPPYTCSPLSVHHLEMFFEEHPSLLADFARENDESYFIDVEVTPARLEFVPKNAKTHRSIAVEPSITGFVQAGIGDWISERLRLQGIDLSTGQQRHRELARTASIDGTLATIDLSNASDTIAIELVRRLLPEDWFDLMWCFRSPVVSYRGTQIRLEKFSSMGNGFTFPLETLIFYAAALAVKPKGIVSVFGDDIILPTDSALDLTMLLHALGFRVNAEKSFWRGPFRESCGADFLSGYDVRPYYQKGPVSNRSLFVLHNFYVRRHMDDYAALVASWIHPSLRIFGPDGYGDGHLLGDWHPKPHKRRDGWGGYTFETFQLKGRKSVRPLAGDHVALLYSTYTREETREALRWERHDGSGSLRESLEATRDGKLIKAFALPKNPRWYDRLRVYTFTRN